MRKHFRLKKEEFEYLKKFLLHDKNTYKLASQIFFKKPTLEKVATLYAFVRFVDQIVDETNDEKKAREDIKNERTIFFENFEKENPETGNMIYDKFIELCKYCEFEKTWIEAFFDSMEMDLYKKTYETYAELEKYMYGSAGVVGLMMTKIIGFHGKKIPEEEALALGYAMQLTNFLRDIKEDYFQRDRTYIPKEFMDKYSVTDLDIIRYNHFKREWKDMMRELSEKAHSLFEKGNSGIKYLSKDSRSAVYCASLLYEGILEEIEARDYNVFRNKIKPSIFKKIKIIWKTIINK